MNDSGERKKTAPYISFATFVTALDSIASVGVPSIIDRHSFKSMSGGAVAAVLSCLRYFSLITDNGVPSQELYQLANNKEGRKENINTLLQTHFKSVIDIDLMRATPTLFDQAFDAPQYNVTGATKRKAEAFFLKAAAYAGVGVGPLLLNKQRNSGPRKPRKAKEPVSGGKGTGSSTGGSTPPLQDEGTRTSVTLSDGGTLTLIANVNLLTLSAADRTFLFNIIDLIQTHGQEGSAQKAEDPT